MDTNHAEEARTGKVIASAYNVQRSFGYGFAEPVYQRALTVELQFIGRSVARERSYELFHRGVLVGAYRADLVVDDRLIVEVKTGKVVESVARAQLLNYLRAADLPLGLLVHFGPNGAQTRHLLSRVPLSLEMIDASHTPTSMIRTHSAMLLLIACAGSLPAQVKAFTGATLIDGTDRAPVANATIIVRDGRIVGAGPASSVAVPAGATRVALSGKTVIPGIINAHGHVNTPADLGTFAAYGVTTVYSLGGEPASVFTARAEQNTSTLARARVFVAGPVLTPTTPEEARAQVAGVADQKVDIVKIRVDDNLGTTQKMTPEVYRAVIDEAHKRGLRVATHLFYLADAKSLLASGADLVAHSVRDADVDAELITALKARGVCVSPTLMREVSTFVYESTPSFFSDPFFLEHANAEWVATLKQPARQEAMRTSQSAQRYKAGLEVAKRNLKKLSDAGVPIAMGTDTGPTGRFQGYFELMEIEMMVQAGLTPRQALASATRDAARCMKIDRELGTIEAGKWADFVVLDASPLTDIANIRRIASVYVAGNPVAR